MCVGGYVLAIAQVWRSQDNLGVLCFYHTKLKDKTQVVWLGGRCL